MKHLIFLSWLVTPLLAAPYQVEDIKFPAGVPSEVGTQIYVGQTVRGWGKEAEGLPRITPVDEKEPFDITSFEITPKGFQLTFTREPGAEILEKDLRFKSFTYQSKWSYGSPQKDKKDHQITGVRKLGPSAIMVSLENFNAGRVYQLDLGKLKSKDGSEIQNCLFYYTANEIPKS